MCMFTCRQPGRYSTSEKSSAAPKEYHFVRLEIQRGCIQLEYVQSEHNIADIFTKPANKAKLGKFAPIRGWYDTTCLYVCSFELMRGC